MPDTVLLNRGYRFQLGDHPAAEAVDYDDRDWQSVDLPHSFSIPYWGEPDFYVGYGWYRRPFSVEPEWMAGKLLLEFEGAFQDAEVFVNGRLAGGHKGGYTGFRIDISDHIEPGPNVLAVRLNNLWNPELAPRAGEHHFSGGLYRNVWLVRANRVHIPYLGVWITTSVVSNDEAVVECRAQVQNDDESAREVAVRVRLCDPAGELVAQAELKRTIPPGSLAPFNQLLPPLRSPSLWHPDHPHLYTVITSVWDSGRVVDEISTPVGFRWFEFTADRGFFLNGEHCLIHGVNVHQDHAGWGDAITDAACVRDVQMVKDAGFNFIRASHYPHRRALYDACDRIGLLVWSELCFWGTGGDKIDGHWTASAYPRDPANDASFEINCKQQLREMIVEHRNNASIIAWSMCNEVFFSDPHVMGKVRALLGSLVALSHTLDPYRPAGIGGCQRGEIDTLGDVAGYNGDGARLFLEPGVASLVTEYGSCAGGRPGSYDPCWYDMEGQPDFPWRSGKAYWCMFDHASLLSIGDLGCVDYFRLPKRRWFWYRHANLGIPPPSWPEPGQAAAVRIEADRTTIAGDGLDDCLLIATVCDSSGNHISNSPPVTLRIVSGPGRFPTGREIPFAHGTAIPIIEGQAAIEFRSGHAGETVIRAESPGLEPGEIRITTLGAPDAPSTFEEASAPVLIGPRTPVPARPAGERARRNLAQNHPTRCSSEASSHRAFHGNDGDTGTSWRAASGDTGEWWQVDLEEFVAIHETVLHFEAAAVYRYRIALSHDAQTWVTAVDQSADERLDTVRRDLFDEGAKGRYLRITYTGLPADTPAGHCEMEVYGS